MASFCHRFPQIDFHGQLTTSLFNVYMSWSSGGASCYDDPPPQLVAFQTAYVAAKRPMLCLASSIKQLSSLRYYRRTLTLLYAFYDIELILCQTFIVALSGRHFHSKKNSQQNKHTQKGRNDATGFSMSMNSGTLSFGFYTSFVCLYCMLCGSIRYTLNQ